MVPVIDDSQNVRSGEVGRRRASQRQGLFRKYVILFASVVGLAVIVDRLAEAWFVYLDHRAALARLQKEQANSAAVRISNFLDEIVGQVGWTTHLSWASATIDQRQLDGIRLLRQVPAIAEIAMVDGQGSERLRVSRQAMDRVESRIDLSADPRYAAALANKTYWGPVYFARESEPFMTISVAGARPSNGIAIAEVNLKHVWDIITQIRVGRAGRAYVVDRTGRLIAHPDISLVLRNSDLSHLPQVAAARLEPVPTSDTPASFGVDYAGNAVLTAIARVKNVDWIVLVELPQSEANAPLHDAFARSAMFVIGALGLALIAAFGLARRMMIPIGKLTEGARHIGGGALDHRISIKSGDEFEVLGAQFNAMASQLQGAYATLERKVDVRTQQLVAANLVKTRFLAAASHDLRQPLHALNLFVAQLGHNEDAETRRNITQQVEASIADMNDLFNALLDISKLDAGGVQPAYESFPVQRVLDRIDAMFARAAFDKGLHLRIVGTKQWTRSDPVLLERILLNLVSNAVRYTESGGIVVGCRRMGQYLRLDICDTGVGIPPEQQASVFGEFYQVPERGGAGKDGLGLGLAIVDRLCRLLDHPLQLASRVGVGTRFSIRIPVAKTQPAPPKPAPMSDQRWSVEGARIVVIDDDQRVRESTGLLLGSWGGTVTVAASAEQAIAAIGNTAPDLIISDYHLSDSQTGLDAIRMIRSACGAPVPAFIVSGDVAREVAQQCRDAGYRILHKPVSALTLRAVIAHALSARSQIH